MPDTARRILSEVVKGSDPAADKIADRTAITVAELCDLYLAGAGSGRLLTRRKIAKKESRLISDPYQLATRRRSWSLMVGDRYRSTYCSTG